jgi:DNA anti-recombination protein RmuC
MAVMARETWTDERLDDLKEGMNGRFDRIEAEMKEGFARVDKEMKEGFARVDKEMKEGFARVDKEMQERFEKVDKRLDRMDADIRELRQSMSQMHTTMSIGFIGLAGLIVSAQIFF